VTPRPLGSRYQVGQTVHAVWDAASALPLRRD
jgi:hypothetical protein